LWWIGERSGQGVCEAVRVKMSNKMSFQEKTPIYNVIGEIKGNLEPDRAVIMGNHRDAWVFGAADPNSGSACLNEVARSFGAALKSGWSPKRLYFIFIFSFFFQIYVLYFNIFNIFF
jgi:hypothetical protein